MPVRCMLDRDEDMKSTGMRSPFLAKYKVLTIWVKLFTNDEIVKILFHGTTKLFSQKVIIDASHYTYNALSYQSRKPSSFFISYSDNSWIAKIRACRVFRKSRITIE